MEIISQKQKQSILLLLNRKLIFIIVLLAISPYLTKAQCLSSVSPVGGTGNLLVLEKNSLRVISFYKYGQGNQYYEKTQHSDFELINKAFYNYSSIIVGYGLSNKLSVEIESGYFFNKTQVYNLVPQYKLRGEGLSNMIISAKRSIFADQFKRIYLTGGIGAKIPFSRTPQVVNNVELPVEVQPTIGAYGFVFNSSFVKESSGSGMRFFVLNRIETNAPNKYDYKLGTSFFNSFYISKHLMFPWLKGDWTAILQLRNEIRTHDKISNIIKESSGSTLFFVSPQINYVLKEEWYISTMLDIPIYQYFNGTQLGAGFGVSVILSRTIRL